MIFMKISNSHGGELRLVMRSFILPRKSEGPINENCEFYGLRRLQKDFLIGLLNSTLGPEDIRAHREEKQQLLEEKLEGFLDTLNPAERARAVYLAENHGSFVFCRDALMRPQTMEEHSAKFFSQMNNVGLFNLELTNGYHQAPQAKVGPNQLWIGNGTRMTLNNGFSIMFDGERAFILQGGKALGLGEGNDNIRRTAQLANMLRQFANGTLPTKGGLDNIFIFHDDTARHLRALGIDPNQDFTVNGVTMRLVDGRQIHRV